MSRGGTQKSAERLRREFLPIHRRVVEIVQGHHFFLRSAQLLEEIGRPSNSVYSWFTATYGRDVAIGLRWVVDMTRSGGATSFKRFLMSLKNSTDSIGRDWFVGQYTSRYPLNDAMRDAANSKFSDLVGDGEMKLSLRQVESDIRALDAVVNEPGTQSLANTRIAHLNPQEDPSRVPLWGDVNHAIKVVEELCWKYQFLLTQGELGGKRVWRVAPDFEEELREFWCGDDSVLPEKGGYSA